jgi:hypothetical protein
MAPRIYCFGGNSKAAVVRDDYSISYPTSESIYSVHKSGTRICISILK